MTLSYITGNVFHFVLMHTSRRTPESICGVKNKSNPPDFGLSPVFFLFNSLTLCLCHINTFPQSHPHEQFVIPGWSEAPMVHCNGTSRWSQIGSHHRTSLGDGRKRLVSSLRGFALLTHLSCFCISWGKQFMPVMWHNGNKQSNTLLTPVFI